MLTSLQGNGRGISFDDYFKQALNLDVAKLEAIIRGQDHSMPIVAAMAAYEVKKPMVTAAAGQQAQQQLQQAQPTVRQEMEQEMNKSGMIPDMAMLQQQRMGPQPPVLPEQAGVGALPAPNMQGMAMAHGGIIAFDDGGYVPGYAGNNLFARSDVDEEELAALEEEQVSAMRGRGAQPVGGLPEKTRKVLESKDKVEEKQTSAMRGRGAPPVGGLPEKTRKFLENKDKEKLKTDKTPTELKAANAAINAALAKQPTFTEVPPRAPAPALKQKPANVVPGSKSDIDEALEASRRLSGGAAQDYKAALANYGAEVKTGLDALAAEYERGKPAGQAYSKYEQSLLADEAAAKGKEERNLQMALVNAGLAIAGGTSQYALENIGKGALVGTKQYMDGLDKLEAAAKERQKAMAMIEQERRAEARGDWKDKNALAARRTEAELNAKKFGVEGLGKIFELDTKSSTDIYNNLVAQRHADIRNERMAGVYAQRQDPYNVAWDNATKAMQVSLQANPMLAMEYQRNPQKYQQDFDALLQKALSRNTPTGGSAVMPSRSGLKFLGFEKQ
jgi:hypothetical protein